MLLNPPSAQKKYHHTTLYIRKNLVWPGKKKDVKATQNREFESSLLAVNFFRRCLLFFSSNPSEDEYFVVSLPTAFHQVRTLIKMQLLYVNKLSNSNNNNDNNTLRRLCKLSESSPNHWKICRYRVGSCGVFRSWPPTV